MTRSRSTNLLLLLVLAALLANLAVAVARPPAAYAIKKSEVSEEAQRVSERVAMDRVLGDIGPAMREMAQSNREVAQAIREHARSTERIARAVQTAGRRSTVADN